MSKNKGCQKVEVTRAAEAVRDEVLKVMSEDMGIPIEAEMDEYKIGGGLFGSASVSPAVVFSSEEHVEYASVFAAFKKTGALLEVTIVQKGATSRNYQKEAQGKMFANKAAAAEEDTYHSAISQAVIEAVESIIG